jgi:hypothetical protein
MIGTNFVVNDVSVRLVLIKPLYGDLSTVSQTSRVDWRTDGSLTSTKDRAAKGFELSCAMSQWCHRRQELKQAQRPTNERLVVNRADCRHRLVSALDVRLQHWARHPVEFPNEGAMHKIIIVCVTPPLVPHRRARH